MWRKTTPLKISYSPFLTLPEGPSSSLPPLSTAISVFNSRHVLPRVLIDRLIVFPNSRWCCTLWCLLFSPFFCSSWPHLLLITSTSCGDWMRLLTRKRKLILHSILFFFSCPRFFFLLYNSRIVHLVFSLAKLFRNFPRKIVDRWISLR